MSKSNSNCNNNKKTKFASNPLNGLQTFNRVFFPLFFAFLFAFLIIFFIKGKSVVNFGLEGWLFVLLLFGLFYIIIKSISIGRGDLPYATNPMPPHLGLDGVSVRTYSGGTQDYPPDYSEYPNNDEIY